MYDENILKPKSKKFALRIIKLYEYLQEQKKEFVMSKQILKSGTSIGANIMEGIYAQSRPDFGSKLSIALKEAGETEWWLELLEEAEYINKKEVQSMLVDCREIIRILSAITKKIYEK